MYLGGGAADLLGVESTGRVAIIEVKLARNPEARRAVIAQVLAYAAYLRGFTPEDLQSQVLGLRHLGDYSSLLEAVKDNDEEGTVDDEAFQSNLRESLEKGRFRLVFVLDDAPPELVRVVGYLEALTDKLVIDLITVKSYEVNGRRIVLPQRVSPERVEEAPLRGGAGTRQAEQFTGSDVFAASIEHAEDANRPLLRRLLEWARNLEHQRCARLVSVKGLTRHTLVVRLIDEDVSFVTVFNDAHSAYITVHASVLRRRAAAHVPAVEGLLAPTKLIQSTSVKEITDDLLKEVAAAYVDAARGAAT